MGASAGRGWGAQRAGFNATQGGVRGRRDARTEVRLGHVGKPGE